MVLLDVEEAETRKECSVIRGRESRHELQFQVIISENSHYGCSESWAVTDDLG